MERWRFLFTQEKGCFPGIMSMENPPGMINGPGIRRGDISLAPSWPGILPES